MTLAMHPDRRGSGSAWLAAGLGLLGLLLWAPSLAVEGVPGPLAPPGRPARIFPKPDRPVAEIISPIWATEKQRDAVDEAGQVARILNIGPGMVVADLGAGSGYHTTRMAKLVGPAGRIIAEDVMPLYLTGLQRRVDQLRLANVTVARGEPHDPRLPPASTDIALLVHMYHEIEQPFAFLHNLAPAMRPGGRVGIVDLDRETHLHGTPPALLRCELAAVGYREIQFANLSGDIGYLAVFEVPAPGSLPDPSAIKPCSSRASGLGGPDPPRRS
jgi:SAM-dependent methyltransferase